MEQCGRLLVQMMCRGDARYFNTLVSDTTTMIYHPLIAPAAAARAAAARAQTDFIDLSIVAHRLRVGGYSGVLGFRQDVLRVLATAASPPGCLPADEPPNVGAGRRLASWFAEIQAARAAPPRRKGGGGGGGGGGGSARGGAAGGPCRGAGPARPARTVLHRGGREQDAGGAGEDGKPWLLCRPRSRIWNDSASVATIPFHSYISHSLGTGSLSSTSG